VRLDETVLGDRFSVGWVSAHDDYGRTVWTVNAHRPGKRFVLRADEKLTACAELESAIWGIFQFHLPMHHYTHSAGRKTDLRRTT